MIEDMMELVIDDFLNKIGHHLTISLKRIENTQIKMLQLIRILMVIFLGLQVKKEVLLILILIREGPHQNNLLVIIQSTMMIDTKEEEHHHKKEEIKEDHLLSPMIELLTLALLISLEKESPLHLKNGTTGSHNTVL